MTAEFERLIRAAGPMWRYLPAYSPDLNPIEKAVPQLTRRRCGRQRARTVDGLESTRWARPLRGDPSSATSSSGSVP